MARRKNMPKTYQCLTCEQWFAPQGIGPHQTKLDHEGRVLVSSAEARARMREEQALEYEHARAMVAGYTPPEAVEGLTGGLTASPSVPLVAKRAVTPPVERPKAQMRVVDPNKISLRIVPGVVVEDDEGNRYLLTEFDNA